MKSLAYGIAGAACLGIAAFAPGLVGIGASIWAGVLLTALLLRNEP